MNKKYKSAVFPPVVPDQEKRPVFSMNVTLPPDVDAETDKSLTRRDTSTVS